MRVLIWVGLISLSVFLESCANPFHARSPIPDDAMTIEQIYGRHSAATVNFHQRINFVPDGTSQLEGYSRSVANELSVQFPRLPNPTIILYVYPHLSLEGTPVPGYSTLFQMYENVEYALPGEIVQ